MKYKLHHTIAEKKKRCIRRERFTKHEQIAACVAKSLSHKKNPSTNVDDAAAAVAVAVKFRFVTSEDGSLIYAVFDLRGSRQYCVKFISQRREDFGNALCC